MKKGVLFCVSVGLFFCANVQAMQKEPKVLGTSGVEHPLGIDLLNPTYDSRMGDNVCSEFADFVEQAKWYGGIAQQCGYSDDVIAWDRKCKKDRVALQQDLRQAQEAHSGGHETLRPAEALSRFDNEIANACFHVMQAVGKSTSRGTKGGYGSDDELKARAQWSIGRKACHSLDLFREGIAQGLYSVDTGVHDEVSLGIKACQVRERLSVDNDQFAGQKVETPASFQRRVSLQNLEGRLAFFVSALFKQANHCQYGFKPGYTLETHHPRIPLSKSTASVQFIRTHLNASYAPELGDEACESLQRLMPFLKDAKAEGSVRMALEVCKKRAGWITEYNAYPNDDNDRDRQKRKPVEEKLLAVDGMLARYSSESFLRWQEKLPHLCAPQVYDALKTVRDTETAESLSYVPELGGAACKALGYVYRRIGKYSDDWQAVMNQCDLRQHLLDNDPVRGAVATKQPPVLSAFRRFDNAMALMAYRKIRSGYGYYSQSDFTGFCIGSKSGMENEPDAVRPSRGGSGGARGRG